MVPLVPSIGEAAARVRASIQTGLRETGSAGDMKLLQSLCVTFHQSAPEWGNRVLPCLPGKRPGHSYKSQPTEHKPYSASKRPGKQSPDLPCDQREKDKQAPRIPTAAFPKTAPISLPLHRQRRRRPREQGGITEFYTPQGHDTPKNLSLEACLLSSVP